jgi:hypothetical protein
VDARACATAARRHARAVAATASQADVRLFLEAGADDCLGRRSEAIEKLRALADLSGGRGLLQFRTAGRVRLGQLLGGAEGAAIVERELAALRGAGVVKPLRFLNALVPGVLELPGRAVGEWDVA